MSCWRGWWQPLFCPASARGWGYRPGAPPRLLAGFGGAAITKAGMGAIIGAGWVKPILFIFLSPLVGLAGAFLLTVGTSWVVRRQAPRRGGTWGRRVQLLSAGARRL